jgi:hypothetical protein
MLYDGRHALTGLRRQWALVVLLYGGSAGDRLLDDAPALAGDGRHRAG